MISALIVVAAYYAVKMVLELLYNGFYYHKIAQQTQYHVCEQDGVCK